VEIINRKLIKMPTIIIQGTPIEFPDSDQSPNWAPAVIQFAQAVESALSIAVGTFDVSPQVMNIDAYNPGTNVNINNLSFSTTQVRGAFIQYTVYRNTSTTTVVEGGTIEIAYNPDGPVNNKWEISRVRTGDASITFSITDVGQMQFSTSTLGGIDHVGRLSYEAKALEQD